jgi:AcrR family transcriptional regulator
MSIVVEHAKRQREILDKALDIFIEEGYENATFQKIADRCDITRTTLYIYFKNKREIFNYSIKQLLGKVEEDILKVKENQTLNCAEKITNVLLVILERLEESRRLLLVILDVLLNLSKGGMSPDSRVRRRTVRLRHILATMVIEGIRTGEIEPINIRAADDLLYGIIETAIFRLVVLKRASVSELKYSITLAVGQLRSRANKIPCILF